MGLPVILAAVAIGGQVIGGFQKAAADRQAASAQQQAYEAKAKESQYQAQVAENNRQTSEQNARVAAAAGEQQAFNKGMETRQKVGGIVAGQAASGVDVSSGSALDVKSSTQELGQVDALTIRSNAAREAYGYQVQGSNFGAQAEADRFGGENDITAGQNAKKAGDIAATGSILSGITGAANTAASAKALF